MRAARSACTALLAAILGVLPVTSGTQGVYDSQGQRLGEVRTTPQGGYEVYDTSGRRIGTGRRSLYDGSIRVYDPRTMRPLYEIREGGGGRRR